MKPRAYRDRRFIHLSDERLTEYFILTSLDWLQAHSWGVEPAKEDALELGRKIAAEMLRRGLPPSTVLYKSARDVAAMQEAQRANQESDLGGA